jgi:hypothetical protein
MAFSEAGASQLTTTVLSAGVPSTDWTPAISLNSFLMAITQWPQEILGI